MEEEVKTLRLLVSDLHLKHRTLSRELQNQRDIDAKNKAQLKHLKGNFLTVKYSCDVLAEIGCKCKTMKENYFRCHVPYLCQFA